MDLHAIMDILYFVVILVDAGAFVFNLVDAIRATDEAVASNKKAFACANFVCLMGLLAWFARG